MIEFLNLLYFIGYELPPNSYQGFIPPTVLQPTPVTAAIKIGFLFLLFVDVINTYPKRKKQKYGPDGKARIAIFLFGVYFIVTMEYRHRFLLIVRMECTELVLIKHVK